jgi:ATP-dependent helicase/nuclease subunit A
VLSDDQLIAADRSARLRALDITRSYIVQAPAGSGKTELLIQRYLRLLAIVNNPEEVVAITFTRKAAAEMRLRVLEALTNAEAGAKPQKSHERLTFDAANAVLKRDAALSWNVGDFPRRMRIQTLDALSAGIARAMPLSSTLGGTPQTLADAEMKTIYRSAAAATFDWLAGTDRLRDVVERTLVHLDNNPGVYTEYVARMLETRDQWLGFVGAGASAGDQIGAIRGKLENRIAEIIADRLEIVRDLMPIGMMESLLSLADYASENLRQKSPNCPVAALAGLTELPGADFDGLPGWRGVAELLLTKAGTWRKTVSKREGFPTPDNGERKKMLALLGEIRDQDELRKRLHRVRQLPPHRYSDEQWDVLLALLNLLPLAVAELRRIFGERGVVDHIEVALAANLALGSADDPGDMALLLDYQISHLLIDEMQDTSISQYYFLEKLVAGWEDGDGRTLFCVGDPMQSIYRFRNAEVGQFLVARDQGISDLLLEPLVLRRNFRSGEKLVHWFNDTFSKTLPAEDDVSGAAIAYAEAVSVEEHAGKGECRIHPLFGSGTAPEVEKGIDVLRACLEESDDETIAVLVRSRTALPALLAALRNAKIPYQAVEIDRLTELPEIIDILALTRAMCHFGDRIAWLALLRGPWVGLSWDDLHRIVKNDSHSIVWDLLRSEDRVSRLQKESARRVRDFVQTMQKQLVTSPGKSLRERLETAWFALGGPAFLNGEEELENIYRFLAVIEKSETAGTLADVARLESLLDDERVSSAASSRCRLQIMTMHRAKGLQFDQVLLYGLGRVAGKSEKSVLSWLNFPGQHGSGDMIISPVGPRSELELDPLHRFIEISERDKDDLEQDRLLYVACTRAKKSLHLLGHVPLASDGQSFRPPQAGSLLRRIWPCVKSAFENSFNPEGLPADSDDDSKLVDPLLRRFTHRWRLPDAPALPTPGTTATGVEMSHETVVEYHWVGSSARHTGTIVHRWLQKAADGIVQLSLDSLAELRPTSRRWSERLGVPAKEVDEICDRVEQAVRGILSDARGQWALYGAGYAELPVSGIWNGNVESVVIDRVRIDDDGVHWIIDYKTSAHEGGDLEGFLNQETERYRPQLEKYAALYRELSNAAVRVALYFPLLQEFREVPVAQDS